MVTSRLWFRIQVGVCASTDFKGQNLSSLCCRGCRYNRTSEGKMQYLQNEFIHAQRLSSAYKTLHITTIQGYRDPQSHRDHTYDTMYTMRICITTIRPRRRTHRNGTPKSIYKRSKTTSDMASRTSYARETTWCELPTKDT